MLKNDFFLDYSIPNNSIFLDIETSGLSVDDDILILSFAQYFNDNKCKITTLIKDNNNSKEQEESSIINSFLNSVFGKTQLYTFNGDDFEYKILNSKLEKYKINFNFDNFELISLQKTLKNYSNYISLSSFSRENIENYFHLSKNKYYDMKKITSSIKKNDMIVSEDMKEHNLEEINTLINIYLKFEEFRFSNRVFIGEHFYYLYDFHIVNDYLSLIFKTDKKNSLNTFFFDNAMKLSSYNNTLTLQILIKTVIENNSKIILCEYEQNYIPLFIQNDIIYENIYYLLSTLKSYL